MVSSLNATLARLSAIEGNFTALENFSNKINQSYAIRNYGSSIEAAKNTAKEGFEHVLNTKDKIEKKAEEVFEQALDMLQTQEMVQKPTLLEKIGEKSVEMALKDKISDKLSEIAILEKFDKPEPVTLRAKIEQFAPIETLKEKIVAQEHQPKKVPLQRKEIDAIISSVSKKYDVDENFIRAIIRQESGFNPNARSKSGAMGLMQLMPITARHLGVADAYSPSQNVDGGVRYIKSLIDKYDGDMRVALAAYNAGPTAVKRYGGVPPYKETQNYVNKIMAAYEQSNEVSI